VDGIRLIGNSAVSAVIVDHVSDEMKGMIHARLNEYCYGATRVLEDSTYYSFEKTVEQFLERFESKHRTTQIGMAGELLVHLLMPMAHPSLTNVSIYFNKEERSIKKGFDLTFFHESAQTVWYSEVKSGEPAGESADAKAASLMATAASDLAAKMTAHSPRSRWESAQLDAGLAIRSEEAKTVKALLRRDATVVDDGNDLRVNAVLAVSVFHDLQHCEIDETAVIAAAQRIAASNRFDDLRVIAAQQSVFDEVIEFLRTQA
jgi:hypothetical protein